MSSKSRGRFKTEWASKGKKKIREVKRNGKSCFCPSLCRYLKGVKISLLLKDRKKNKRRKQRGDRRNLTTSVNMRKQVKHKADFQS